MSGLVHFAAYLAAGRVGGAIALFEQTLVIFQRQLGPDHPDTRTSQNDLASAFEYVSVIERSPRGKRRYFVDTLNTERFHPDPA